MTEAVLDAVQKGASFGAPTENELLLAEMISDAVPSIEMLRLVNSGTEAAMSAIRLARGYTGRDMILKFEGCYHGHSDGLLIKAGSGALTAGVPDSAGVPADYARNTVTCSYNDCEEVREVFKKFGSRLAAIIVEPVAANMGVVLPTPDFLNTLREITWHHGSLLIFDEVITGFRVSYGGAQQHYGIIPDITVLGKIIGGGMPVGAYGGKKEIMKMVAPLGPVYQAGTLSGNPIATAAGAAALKTIKDTPDIYDRLESTGKALEDAYIRQAERHNVKITVNRIGSLMGVFFTDREVVNFSTAKSSDISKFKTCFAALLDNGIYTAPSPYEALFVSYVHNENDISATEVAIDKAFSLLSSR